MAQVRCASLVPCAIDAGAVRGRTTPGKPHHPGSPSGCAGSAAGTVPDVADAQAGDPLSGTGRRILSLPVVVIVDKAVASRTGLSRRTVQRRIQRVMTLAGAMTRMRLAGQAGRRGRL